VVTIQEVDAMLKHIGSPIRYWGRSEVKELCNVLMPGEQIKHCINGRYEGGFGMLCASDQRILLIDKKPLYLTLEDIRYDMVAEVDFHIRLLDSTMSIVTPTKKFGFLGFRQNRMRAMTTYIQNRVMEFRQMHMMGDMPRQDNSVPITQDTTMQAAPAVTTRVLDPVSLNYQYSTSTPDPNFYSQVTDTSGVTPIQFRMTNPYTKLPLMIRRRVGRFSS
jgi:hypothetical protein